MPYHSFTCNRQYAPPYIDIYMVYGYISLIIFLLLLFLSLIYTHIYSSVMLFCILMLLIPPRLYLETRKVRERKVMWINCSRMQLKIALNRWISVKAAFAIQNIISFPFSSRPPSQQPLFLQITLTSLPDSSSGENHVNITSFPC